MITAQAARKQARRRGARRREAQGWLLTSPYLIFMLIFFLIPLLWSI